MEVVMVVGRLVLAFIFISSGISALRHWSAHLGIIKDYRIIPASWTMIFGYGETLAKWLVGLLLLFGSYNGLAGAVGSALLLVYSVAMAINLQRGRKELSCGCGGVVGNHSLAWGLVLRNVGLIAVSLGTVVVSSDYGSVERLAAGVPAGRVFGKEYGAMACAAGVMILVVVTLGSLKDIHTIILKLGVNRSQ